ncbi:MAG: YsnF/AvaK domain-containing protein [Sphingobium sp.]|nr:YsnF/AvaK domain-containing protein [Sphingobium sp.]
MPSTITALYDSRSEAEAAKARLLSANVDAEHVHVHDQSSSGYRDQGYSTHEDLGIWDSIKNAFLPDEDRHTYEEGLRRGGTLLTADVDDDRVDEAVRVLEDAGSIDIDERASQWRSSGWDYAATVPGAGGKLSTYDEGSRTDATLGSEREDVIPVAQEELVVGKRDVNRGGVRVRSYISETPVHEQIRLRNEHVNVERRAVDQPLSTTDTDAFRERTIDVTATGEEAVVGKTARVVEEVVVTKTAEEHVEDIDDTVRRTEVEVDRDTDVERTGTVPGSTDRRF